MLLIFLIDQHFSVKKGQLKRFDINNNNKQFIKLLLGELERTLFNVSLAGCLLVNGNKKTKIIEFTAFALVIFFFQQELWAQCTVSVS